MTTTSPDSLRTPNNTDAYNLVADLATLASDTQDALIARANAYKGTGTQRAAFTTAPNGTLWQDTDGNKTLYRKDTSGWVNIDQKVYGTSAEREAITPTFGQMWTDTDGSKYTWKGDSSGSWRRRSGRMATGSAAWATVGDDSAGRSVTLSIPTTVESGEGIIVGMYSGGSGFNTISAYAVGTSSGGNTPVSIRIMQILNNSATQNLNIWWELVDLPA